MFNFKEISPEVLNAIIKNTAEKMNVQETIIEKDYWVCFVLNYLFHKCKWKNAFTFKGGTSLSKGFELIKRFSEDIDLILDWRLLGYEKEEPWENRSKNKQDKFNKESNKKAEAFLKEEFVKQMNLDFKNMIKSNFEILIDDEDKQTILFKYPKTFKSPYLIEVIRLEIGALAAWTPSENVYIKPYIKKFYSQLFEGEHIEIRTVSPERTFWEKATILHHEANRPKNLNMPKRYARHYYDLYCIANSEYKEKAFNKLDILEKVVEFKNKFYPRTWAKYEEATSKKIRLLPDEYRLKELKDDYENMKEMFFGTYPDFEELIFTITELEKEIHKIKI